MAQRILHFIRHGQYVPSPEGGTLTALGKRQVKRTGKRLNRHGIRALYASDLSRAQESAALIGDQVGARRVKTTDVLRETTPTAVRGVSVPLASRSRGRKQLAAIDERFFVPSRTTRHEVFVCHGNLIRALLMQALDLRMTAWIDLDIHHGSITSFAIYPTWRVRLIRFNDIGHLPPSMVSER